MLYVHACGYRMLCVRAVLKSVVFFCYRACLTALFFLCLFHCCMCVVLWCIFNSCISWPVRPVYALNVVQQLLVAALFCDCVVDATVPNRRRFVQTHARAHEPNERVMYSQRCDNITHQKPSLLVVVVGDTNTHVAVPTTATTTLHYLCVASV